MFLSNEIVLFCLLHSTNENAPVIAVRKVRKNPKGGQLTVKYQSVRLEFSRNIDAGEAFCLVIQFLYM